MGDLCLEAAAERARLITAALRAGEVLRDGDAGWAGQALPSLVGLLDAAGRERTEGLTAPLTRDHPQLLTAIEALDAQLAAKVRPSEQRVALGELAAFAREQAARAAQDVPGAISIDVPPHPAGWLPRPHARLLVDVLGQIVRAAVRFGIPNGGAVRIAFEPGAEVLVVAISDRASRESAAVAASGERDGVLAAASARIAAVGGELISGGGPWGGTGTTIRLPLAASRPARTRWREGV